MQNRSEGIVGAPVNSVLVIQKVVCKATAKNESVNKEFAHAKKTC
jgi:hypothetical protein